MELKEIGAMYEAVKAAYPNAYGWQTPEQGKVTISEWYKSLGKYPTWIVEQAWQKYKTEFTIRELNIALFVGVIKDIQAKNRRDEQRQIETVNGVVRDEAWYAAKEECFRKCQKIFGWSEQEFNKIMGQEERA